MAGPQPGLRACMRRAGGTGMPDLRALLADGHVHVTDGAMGTMLYSKGVFLNVCYDELNLRQPDVDPRHPPGVRAGRRRADRDQHLRRQPDEAGAPRPRRRDRGDQRGRGAGGPRGGRRPGRRGRGPRPARHPDRALRRDLHRGGAERVRPAGQGLLAGGVDGFLCETFSDVEELRAAVEAIKSVSDLPIIAQMTVGEDGRTHYGTAPSAFGPAIAAMGVDVIGVNCSVGPHGVLEAIEHLARVVSLPTQRQPNAGLPRDVGGRKMYMASPEYMASYAKRMVEAGARFVGGCCGTTPEHIKAMVGFVQSACTPARERDDRPGGGAGRRAGAARRALQAGRQAGPRVSSSPRWKSCRPREWIRPRCTRRYGPSRRPAWTP